jgi:hypothetical protein
VSNEPIPSTSDQEPPSPLAIHADPSRHRPTVPSPPLSKSGVAWIRPSDLPTMIGGRVLGRGLDLKAELVRRAKHAIRPHAPRARTTRTAIAAPAPPSITHRPGGISL